ncbi:MAG TPA: hypothetical protein VED40_18400 [Azospirillaceae bacterium]|jgi:hypothetical protein|nr:hypothetical protein [Azospirillaceae bacterium]
MTDMTFSTALTATESKGFFARLWAAAPTAESVFMLGTALGLALIINQVF